MREQKNRCEWRACRANKGGECSIIQKVVYVNGKKSEIDTASCPFYMTQEMFDADQARKEKRFRELGIEYLLNYSEFKSNDGRI